MTFGEMCIRDRVYTTSVSKATLDECPMAYKGMQDILDNIGPVSYTHLTPAIPAMSLPVGQMIMWPSPAFSASDEKRAAPSAESWAASL